MSPAGVVTKKLRRVITETSFVANGRILLLESHLAEVGRLARASAPLLMHVN